MDSASLFNKQGDLKDKLALYHVIDSSGSQKSWDVSEELTACLEKQLARKDTLYVVPVKSEIALSSHKNPFEAHPSWINNEFSTADYVVFTELLKYENPQAALEENQIDTLDISLRVRVFKKTESVFTPILQEIVQESYPIPSLLKKSRLIQPTWQTQGYELSPIGIAHDTFTSLVAKRIRDYIKLNP